jgi:hypothetical protein
MNPDSTLAKEIAIFEKEIAKASDSIYGTLIAHLYVEHLLDRYLKTKVPVESELFGENGFSFRNKLKLVKGLGGFNLELLDSLTKLNSIRNNCAHSFGYQITEKEVANLKNALGKDYKRILKEYPEAEIGAIAPIIWNICGQLLSVTLEAEKYAQNN